MNNPLSYSSVKLDVFSKDGASLKPASGFVVEAREQYYLITNRHVVSREDIPASDPQEPVIKPHILKTSIHIYTREAEKTAPLSLGVRQRITLRLYDENDAPRWVEPQADGQRQSVADVVALSIPQNLALRLFSGKIQGMNVNVGYWPNYELYYWSKISAIPISAIDTDVEYGPPDTVYVIGYPLAWPPAATYKFNAAFWRTCSIASENSAVGMSQANAFFVDPCALEGMTGSPVVGMKDNRTKLLGVYSDRSPADFGADAGLVWDSFLVKELIGAV